MNINLKRLNDLDSVDYSTDISLIKSNVENYLASLYEKLDDNNLMKSDVYIGEIMNNNIKGDGILIKRNKLLIKGRYDSLNYIDRVDINMIDKDLDNIYLKGSIINNKFVYGVVSYGNVKLEGEFEDGLPNNSCKYNSDDVIYDGEWNKGVMSGLGYYEDKNIKYQGEWVNNKFEGDGLLFEDNIEYNGLFRLGKKHGNGDLVENGVKYYVEYDNGKEILKLDSKEKKIIDLSDKIKNQTYELNNFKSLIQIQENQILTYNQKVKILEKEKKNIEETFLCKICFTNIPNILLKPCLHVAMCGSCENTMRSNQNNQTKRCPICRKCYVAHSEIYIC